MGWAETVGAAGAAGAAESICVFYGIVSWC